MSFWVAGTAVVLSITASAVAGFSAYQQGRAQEDMYKAQADMANRQAEQAEIEAQKESELIQDQAAKESKQLRREQLRLMAKQKASLAAMGISGVTAEDIIADTTKIQEDDKSTLRWNADTASWEAKTTGDYQSWQYRGQSAMKTSAAANTRSATNMGVATSILNTASDAVGAFGSGYKVGSVLKKKKGI